METNDENKSAPSVDVPRLVRYSEDVQEDATGQFYINPVTGLRVDKPADGWPKTGHHVTFTPIKVRLAEKINLGLSNRDGEIMIGKGVDGRCYLIAEAVTYHNTEVFEGLGSTEHIEITAEAFLSLANVIAMASPACTHKINQTASSASPSAPCSPSSALAR